LCTNVKVCSVVIPAASHTRLPSRQLHVTSTGAVENKSDASICREHPIITHRYESLKALARYLAECNSRLSLRASSAGRLGIHSETTTRPLLQPVFGNGSPATDRVILPVLAAGDPWTPSATYMQLDSPEKNIKLCQTGCIFCFKNIHHNTL
jgi:hypothetical protein